MSLTVPTAGVIAGRSATVRIATPDTGAILSDFGAKMVEVGTKWKAERLQLQGQQAQLAITRDLGQARQEVEQIADPAAIGPAWDAKVAEITDRYITHDESGKLTIDPKLAEQLGLTLTGLSDQHGLALGNRVIELTRSQQEATWIEARDQITTAAVTADPETFGALLAQGEAWIDARAASGRIDPAAAATEKQTLRREVLQGRAEAAIQNDPQGFLTAADAGQFDAMGGDLLGSNRLAAERELARRATEAEKAAKMTAKARSDAIDIRLTEMTKIIRTGARATDEAFLSDPEVMASEKYGAAKAALDLRNEIPGIRQLTVAELDGAIAAEQASPVAHDYQTERLAVLRQWRDEAAVGWATDAPAIAEKAGLPVPKLPDFNPADPQTYAAGIFSRLSFEKWVQAQGYTTAPAALSPSDKAKLKPVLDPKADFGPKLALAEALAAGTQGDPRALAGQIGASPAFVHAAGIMATTGNSTLAQSILRGEQKDALGTVALPSTDAMNLTFDEVTGGIFADDPTLRAQYGAAARARYADLAAGVDPSQKGAGITVLGVGWRDDPAAVQLYTDAVQQVLGATPTTKGALTIGGVQEINGAMVALPPGVAAAEVDAALDVIGSKHLQGQRWTPEDGGGWTSAATATPPDPLRALKGASITGAAPAFGPDPRAWFDMVHLRRVGESDIYEMQVTVDGRTYTIPQADDPNGTAYRFVLSDLIRETRP